MLTLLPYMAPVELPINTNNAATTASSVLINSAHMSPSCNDGVHSPRGERGLAADHCRSMPVGPLANSSNDVSGSSSATHVSPNLQPSSAHPTSEFPSISLTQPSHPLLAISTQARNTSENVQKERHVSKLTNGTLSHDHAPRETKVKAESKSAECPPDFTSLERGVEESRAFIESVFHSIFDTTVGRCAEVAMQVKASIPNTHSDPQNRPRILQSRNGYNADLSALRQMCRIFGSFNPLEDTDSSSSDDDCVISQARHTHSKHPPSAGFTTPQSKLKRLSFDERYLAERARSHVNMQWVQSEIFQTKCAVSNLKQLHKRLKSHPSRRLKCVPEGSDSSQVASDHCSRTSAFQCSRREKYYTSLFCDTLNPAFNGPGARDSSVQCQCRYPECGPCIICCGQRHRAALIKPIALSFPWNEASTATRLCPLDASAHTVLTPFYNRSLHLQVAHRLGNMKYSGRRLHWTQMPWRNQLYRGEVPPSIQSQYAYTIAKVDPSQLPSQPLNVSLQSQPLANTTIAATMGHPSSLDTEKSTSLPSHSFIPTTANTLTWQSPLKRSPLKSYNALKHRRKKAAAIKSRLKRSSQLRKKWQMKLVNCDNGSSDAGPSRLGIQLLDSLRQRRECLRDIPVPGWSLVPESQGARPSAFRLSGKLSEPPTGNSMSSVVMDCSEAADVSLSLKVMQAEDEDTSDEAYLSVHAKEKETEWERFVRMPTTQFIGYRRAMALPTSTPALEHSFSVGDATSTTADAGSNTLMSPTFPFPRRHSVSVAEQANNIRLRYRPSPRTGYEPLTFPLSAEAFATLQDETESSE